MFSGITLGIALLAAAFAGRLLFRVFKSEAGGPDMLDLSAGAEAAFLPVLKRQGAALGAAGLAAAALIYFLLAFFTSGGQLGAVRAAFAFLTGVLFQALAGLAAARLFFSAALRTAAAVRRSGDEAFTLAVRASGASAIVTLALSLGGVAVVLLLSGGRGDMLNAPLKIAGFCLGSAFAALFLRLSGGAAAATAGNGAMGSLSLGADLFDSASAENVAAMALGAALWPVYGPKAVIFPLFARAWGLAACAAGVMAAGPRPFGPKTEAADVTPAPIGAGDEPKGGCGHMGSLDKGLAAAAGTALAGLFLGCSLGLDGNMWLFMAALIGVVSAGLFTCAARYYGEYKYRPARMAAGAASGGAAAAVIRALSSGLESAAAPAVLTAAAVMGSYYCGVRGLESFAASGFFGCRTCGLYGVAAAVVGTLSLSGYILSLGVFGAVADGARVINGLTHQDAAVKLNTGALAAAGRTALYSAGGYAGAAAVLAAILLFFAYLRATSLLTGLPFETVNFAGAEGFAGGLFGAMLVFLFCAFCLRAGLTPDGSASLPDNFAGPRPFNSVMKRLAVPAALALFLPPAAALIFRRSGFGPEALSAMLISAVISGALMSAFARNAAASLESAAAFIEEGGNGGPGGGPYKAIVESCPVCIVLKDTAGPALNVFIKILPAMALALAALFV